MCEQQNVVRGFDLLLKRNVQHIWEKIFLSLDYATFKNCLKVSKEWNEVLQKKSFKLKARYTFAADMWMQPQNHEEQEWKTNKRIVAWTANSEEVAYVEKTGKSLLINFINSDGKLSSENLTSVKGEVEDLWILHHVIIAKTRENIIAVDKEELKQNTISSRENLVGKNMKNNWPYESVYFDPAIGIRFLSLILLDEVNPGNMPNPGRHARFSVREVPYDFRGEKQLQIYSTANDPHIYNIDRDIIQWLEGQTENMGTSFSEEGSHFICWDNFIDRDWDGIPRGGINVYSIEGESSNLKIRHLWDKCEIVRNAKSNMKYVVYITPGYAPEASLRGCRSTSFLMVRDIETGEKICSHELWPDSLSSGANNTVQFMQRTVFLTKKYACSAFTFIDHDSRLNKVAFLTANLDTHDARSFISEDLEDLDLEDLDSEDLDSDDLDSEDLDIKIREEWSTKMNQGRTGIYKYYSDHFVFLNLTSSDPETLFTKSRIIKSAPKAITEGRRRRRHRRHRRQGPSHYTVIKFMEIKPGVCLFQVGDLGALTSSNIFVMKLLAFKGEVLPKALTNWHNICEDKDDDIESSHK